MSFKNVTVAGSGVLGYQIAFQTAFYGFDVIVYDINDQILEKAKAKFDSLSSDYIRDIKASPEQIKATFDRLSYSSDLGKSLENADLMIEAVPEDPAIKIEFYKKASASAPEKTVFVTNTSTLLPSDFAKETGRPSKFLALHFANDIWVCNTAEVMGHADTSQTIFDEVVKFANNIGMVPIPLYKEQPGYILNSLLAPLLDAANDLLVNEVSDAENIDKTWMIATGAPKGPFGIIDMIGITTVFNVTSLKAAKTKDPSLIKISEYLQKEFIAKNKLGVSTGEGFYKYPDPNYKKASFLKS